MDLTSMIINRTSKYTIESGRALPRDIIRHYSRMKYGDPISTKILARLLLEKLLSSSLGKYELSGEEGVTIASSAFGSIPTAAYFLTEELAVLLGNEEVPINRVKIQREQALGRQDYAKLNHHERGAYMGARKLSISKHDLVSMRGRPLLVVDDLIATGSHERAIVDTLKIVSAVSQVHFVYLLEFSEELRYSNPMVESHINHHSIKKIDDFVELFDGGRILPYINARVVKFLLAEGMSNIKAFKDFLNKSPLEFCKKLYLAAVSSDLVQLNANFVPVINMLKNEILDRQIDHRLEFMNQQGG